MTTYIGNAFSLEGPALGSLRLVRGTVQSCMDPDYARPGLLVQEYDDWLNPAGREVEGWRTVCPLTDAHFMVDLCPPKWYAASVALRDMIERDQPVTLADELAALKEVADYWAGGDVPAEIDAQMRAAIASATGADQ